MQPLQEVWEHPGAWHQVTFTGSIQSKGDQAQRVHFHSMKLKRWCSKEMGSLREETFDTGRSL